MQSAFFFFKRYQRTNIKKCMQKNHWTTTLMIHWDIVSYRYPSRRNARPETKRTECLFASLYKCSWASKICKDIHLVVLYCYSLKRSKKKWWYKVRTQSKRQKIESSNNSQRIPLSLVSIWMCWNQKWMHTYITYGYTTHLNNTCSHNANFTSLHHSRFLFHSLNRTLLVQLVLLFSFPSFLIKCYCKWM